MSRQTRSAAKAAASTAKMAAATTKTATTTKTTTKATRRASAAPIISASVTEPPSIKFFTTMAAWESWLSSNHNEEEAGTWLKIAKKDAGVASVTRDEAVDVALCYGWIDGLAKSHDEKHYIQRFTPRRKRSVWSKRNVEKVAALTQAGRMRPSGQAEVDAAKDDGRWAKAYSMASILVVPDDFQAALEKDRGGAKSFFEALNKTKRYAFLWRLDSTKRAETRQRKIKQYVELLAEHKTL